MWQLREDAADLFDAPHLGMPRSLAAVRIGPEIFEVVAEQAINTRWVAPQPGTDHRSGTGPRDT